ncbi:MAG: RagB/SusD family nutrient uptake outer membrane protein, partial [Bacteroidota bacterium]|nr:RagB/SusD family nutrient uptake outer membrane protein [Bacteroidota bacterium]
MKKYISKILSIVLGIGLTIIIVTSCNEDKFLDVPRTDRLAFDNYPNEPEDFDFLLNDLYGRLRNGMYLAFDFPSITWARGHEIDIANPVFLEFARMDILPSNGKINGVWNNYYSNIARTNSFLDAVNVYRENNPEASADIKRTMDLKEAQVLFIRAFNYFYLVTLYGETAVSEPADLSKMGVPLFTSVAINLEETQKGRSSIGDVYNLIISDLIKAEGILAGVTWPESEIARVNEWGVKGLLGKAYLYSLQYAEAANKFKDIIDNSGKSLVPFNIYRDMFSDMHEFNSESLFELNYNTSGLGSWNSREQTSHFLGVFNSPLYMNGDRKVDKGGGFGNFIVHDKNLLRYGYDYPTIVNQEALQVDGVFISDELIKTQLAGYLDHAREIRENITVDPRLFVTTLQPFYDSVLIENTPQVVVKNPGDGIVLSNLYSWSNRKYAA